LQLQGRKEEAGREAVCNHREGWEEDPDGTTQERFFSLRLCHGRFFFPFAPLNSPYLFSIPNFVVGTMAWFFLELKRPIGITK
jgi:hypothetical protein